MKTLTKSIFMPAIAAMTLLTAANVANAQMQNKTYTKNMKYATYAYTFGDSELACDYLLQELKKHPRNGYAYLYLGYLVINDADLFEMTGYDITFPIECFDRAIEYLPMRDMEAIASASCYRKICYEYFNSSLKNVTNNTEEVFY